MKSTLIPMKEASLSKEVYDKDPRRFFVAFIWFMFVLVGSALAWAYFGQMDIVVRAQGVIRPYAETETVINHLAGDLVQVQFYEGQSVQVGDVLFTIDTFERELELERLEERYRVIDFRRETLRLYLDSLVQGVNLIGDLNPTYSQMLDSFLTNVQSLNYVATAQSNLLIGEQAYLVTALQGHRSELYFLRLLLESVSTNTNLLEALSTQPRSETDQVAFQASLNRYLNHQLDRESRQQQVAYLNNTVAGYHAIREAVLHEASAIDSLPVYIRIFEEFTMRQQQLLALYEVAQERYLNQRQLFEAGAISLQDMIRTETERDTALFNRNEHVENFMIRINTDLTEAQNRQALAVSQLDMAQTTFVATVSNQIFEREQTIESLNNRLNDNQLRQVSVFFLDDDLGEVSIRRFEETNRILHQVTLIEQEMFNLMLDKTNLRDQIGDATVRASIDGTIQTNMELNPGTFLHHNAQVLTIIPEREAQLVANIHVSNRHIGRVAAGQTVRYSIEALPRREYGNIEGLVTRIAADATVGTGPAGYFVVESHLADVVYHNVQGDSTELRVGMAFDARIVVDRERILFHLLDQLNLLLH